MSILFPKSRVGTRFIFVKYRSRPVPIHEVACAWAKLLCGAHLMLHQLRTSLFLKWCILFLWFRDILHFSMGLWMCCQNDYHYWLFYLMTRNTSGYMSGDKDFSLCKWFSFACSRPFSKRLGTPDTRNYFLILTFCTSTKGEQQR